MRLVALLLVAVGGCYVPKIAGAWEQPTGRDGETYVAVDWMHVFGNGMSSPAIAMRVHYLRTAESAGPVTVEFESTRSGGCGQVRWAAVKVDGKAIDLGRLDHRVSAAQMVNWSYIFPGAVGFACSERLTGQTTVATALQLATAESVVIEAGGHAFELKPEDRDTLRSLGPLLTRDARPSR